MNQIVLCGRLTADPDLKYSKNNKAVAAFTIAVERDFKKDGEASADFFNCAVFGKVAEALCKYISKGKRILVSGSMQNANYKDKNGTTHYSMKCIVSRWEFADGKGDVSDEDIPVERNPEPSEPQTDFDDVPFC